MRAGDLWTKERVSEGGEEGEEVIHRQRNGEWKDTEEENILEFLDINTEI